MSSVFLDTSFILETILGKASSSQDARNVLNRLRTHNYHVIIPQTVVAEGLSKLIIEPQNTIQTNTWKFLEWIQTLTDPRTCLPPANKEIYGLALELMAVDNNVDLCDALIIAHALYDQQSQYLLTM